MSSSALSLPRGRARKSAVQAAVEAVKSAGETPGRESFVRQRADGAIPASGGEVIEQAIASVSSAAKPLSQQSDFELLDAFREGSEKAFAELYTRRKSEVYTYCLRMLSGDPDMASDAFQETFIKVYEKAESFRAGTNVMGWLFMIARNTCLNIHRSKRPAETLDEHHAAVSTDRSLRPEHHQEQQFLRELLERTIASLPPEFREPFILREFDGFSYPEIADMTGVTLAMTKVRIHRAKQRMRELLKPYLSDEVSRTLLDGPDSLTPGSGTSAALQVSGIPASLLSKGAWKE